LNAGLRYVGFSYNKGSSLEPRVSLQRNLPKGSLSVSSGVTSQWQQIQTYVVIGNESLKPTRALQTALEWRHHFAHDLNLTSTAYYHVLRDVPTIPSTMYYSVLNQFEDFAEPNLEAVGEGKSYGIETSVEKKFYGQTYFMVSGSFYRSLYLSEGAWYETRFSGNFTTSALGGKEWIKKNKALGVHARILYSGGLRSAPIDPLGSSFFGTTVFDFQNGYSVKFPNYFRTDLRISWRKNKPGYTRTLAIDIQNALNSQNVANQYFDTYLQAIKTRYQVGIVPILVYRVEF